MNKFIYILILILIVFISSTSFSQSFVIYGDKCFGGNEFEHGTSMLKTGDDHLIIAGLSGSDISGNKTLNNCNPQLINSKADIWILEIDPSFNILWQKNIGGYSQESDPIINWNFSNDKILFSCNSNSDSSCDKSENRRLNSTDYWFGLLNMTGDIIWEKTLGGTLPDVVPEMIQLNTGDYIVSGITNSGIGADKTVPNWGLHDYWAIKLDTLGNKIWDNDYGGTYYEGGTQGYYYKILLPSDNGSFVIGGTTESPVSGNISAPPIGVGDDFWIIKIDSAGNKIWDRRYGGDYVDICRSIISTRDHGFLMGGTTQSQQSGDISEPQKGYFDFWIIKLDSLGNKQWDNRLGGSPGSDAELTSLKESLDGGYLLTGRLTSNAMNDVTEPPFGNQDYWIVKIDSLGNKLWDKRFGGSAGSSTPFSITELSDSSIVVLGTSLTGTSAVKTDSGYGSSDYWVIRFKYIANNVAIEELNIFNQSVSVFPNPAKDNIIINSQNDLINKIELVNLLGETIYSQTNINTRSTQFNIQPYPSGFYFVKVSNKKYTVTKRLVKE